MTPPPTPPVAVVTAPTERRNPATVDIDTVDTLAALELLHAQDRAAVAAMRPVLPALAALVDAAAARVLRGGRLHYVGAGTSGRLGVLDAAEVPPTYGITGTVVAHLAGGMEAFAVAAENIEDDESTGVADTADVGAGDVLVGLTASGRTPYVAGALRAARAAGALTALVTANPAAPLAPLADHLIAPDTGAEAITGSTRLKAGTAAKLTLNALSTMLMVRLGRVHSNLMVTMRPTNAKLRGRAIGMLVQATGEEFDACAAALAACDGEVPLALTTLLAGLDPGDAAARERARSALGAAGGRVRAAVADLAGRG